MHPPLQGCSARLLLNFLLSMEWSQSQCVLLRLKGLARHTGLLNWAAPQRSKSLRGPFQGSQPIVAQLCRDVAAQEPVAVDQVLDSDVRHRCQLGPHASRHPRGVARPPHDLYCNIVWLRALICSVPRPAYSPWTRDVSSGPGLTVRFPAGLGPRWEVTLRGHAERNSR